MKYKPGFFTHGNAIIYLESLTPAPTTPAPATTVVPLLSRQLSDDGHKARRFVYNYLVKAPLNWTSRLHWAVNNTDYTNLFQTYRDQSVSLAARKLNLSNNRVLSLSNVFVISKDQPDSFLHRFSSVDFKYLRSYLSPKEDWEKLPAQARLWCNPMDEVIGESEEFPLRAIRQLVRGFEDELDEIDGADDRLYMFCRILFDLVAAFGTWTDNIKLENAFTDQHLSPFIKEIFSFENITMRLGETHICNSHLLHLSDYVGSYQALTGQTYDILTVEIKPPKKSSESQLESDFVKVGKEMKDMIDVLVDLGVETPTVAGALLEGFTMTTYTMQLVYEGVYIMLERSKIALLRSPGDIVLAPRITESLMQLANSMKGTIRDIHDKSISNDPLSIIQQDWKRPSAAVPERTTERTKPSSSPSPSPSTSSSSKTKTKTKN